MKLILAILLSCSVLAAGEMKPSSSDVLPEIQSGIYGEINQ